MINPEWVLLSNSKGTIVELCSLGASLYTLTLPNKKQVLTTASSKEEFIKSSFYYGKTIGRHSGRLFAPSYEIDGISYPVVPYRAEKASLHGGVDGFSTKNFTVKEKEKNHVVFSYVSPEGESNFPGTLKVEISYSLTEKNELLIEFHANTNKDTICNLTNHAYFNLGNPNLGLTDHLLTIKAKEYLDINSSFQIQERKKVVNTLFDFRKPTNLGQRLKDIETNSFKGIDHCFLLDQAVTNKIIVDATSSAYLLEVSTSYPSVVVYTLNDPEKTTLTPSRSSNFHSAFTLECQNEPGGIHHNYLHSSVLRKGQSYYNFTKYSFVEK